MSQKPTLILVPGAWHTPETWGKLVSAMEAEHYKCVPVPLASTLGVEVTFNDDVKLVRDAIVAETTQGRDVVLVVHSFGGAVGASAMKGLTPQNAGEGGHVIGFFMIATGFMISGKTFLDGFDGKPPPIWELNYETGLASLTVDPKQLFYHDLPSEEGDHWVGKLQPQALKTFITGADVGYAGWKEVPVWYLATVEDKALPVEAQRFWVQGAQAEGGNVTLREVQASHSPMLSKPDETSKILLEALAAFAQQ